MFIVATSVKARLPVVRLQHGRAKVLRKQIYVKQERSACRAATGKSKRVKRWKATLLGTSHRSNGRAMPFERILDEVSNLESVSTRLEELAEDHPSVAEPLVSVAASVRNNAVLLAVLVATKRADPV